MQTVKHDSEKVDFYMSLMNSDQEGYQANKEYLQFMVIAETKPDKEIRFNISVNSAAYQVLITRLKNM